METVTIPREEYDALRSAAETLADMQSYDAAKAALARGEDELVPEPFASRLIDGENPLTVFRELRGLSKIALGKASGVHRVQIADIETGRGKGSTATVAALARALGVTVEDLLP